MAAAHSTCGCTKCSHDSMFSITCGLFGISAYLNVMNLIKVIVRFPNQVLASDLQHCSHHNLSTVSLISIVDQALFWIGVLLSFWLLVWYGGAAAIRGGQAGGGSHSAGCAVHPTSTPVQPTSITTSSHPGSCPIQAVRACSASVKSRCN